MSSILLTFKGEFVTGIITLRPHHAEQPLVEALVYTPVWGTNPNGRYVTHLLENGLNILHRIFLIIGVKFVTSQADKDMSRIDLTDVVGNGVGCRPSCSGRTKPSNASQFVTILVGPIGETQC